jgi:phosphatidylglycerol:prolipoprotein diacylglycerol transferase
LWEFPGLDILKKIDLFQGQGISMRQVLFFIPIRSIANALPDIPIFVGPIVIVLAYVVGRARKFPKLFFTLSYIVGGLLVLPDILKRAAAVTEVIPIYGYGAMLFFAFVFCVLLAARLGLREGIDPKHIQDLAIYVFIFGIIGARLTYMIQYERPLWEFLMIWDGGLVFYGGAIGGAVGYFIAYFVFLRKYNVSNWKMADIIAPCAALGLALGRVGCLLNGCCFGNVACAEWRAVHFPLSAPPRYEMTKRGYQTAAGFTLAGQNTIGAVESGSPADLAGLQPGDVIKKVNGQDLIDPIASYMNERGKNDLQLSVVHSDGTPAELDFRPLTIGLHPTQIYESISMFLLVFVLLAYYPFKRHDGSLMVLFMLGYAMHRFLNEMLRTDTDPVAFGMTLSQNISILVLAAGILLAIVVWSRPPSKGTETPAVVEGTLSRAPIPLSHTSTPESPVREAHPDGRTGRS